MPIETPADRAAPEQSATEHAGRPRRLTAAAERALAEAAARHADVTPANPVKEIDGRDGPEPTRYGDWEINGLASDF